MMKLAIAGNALNNVTEIWAYGENVIMVRLNDGRIFKVTAARNMYSASPYKFGAFYEEQVSLGEATKGKTIWTASDLASPGADTVEHCLENALRFLNDSAGN